MRRSGPEHLECQTLPDGFSRASAAGHPEWSGNPVASGKIGADCQVLSSSQVRTLNRYLLIPRRLIFESSVRDASPNLAAAPAGPEMRPLDSASAASIISLSFLIRGPLRSGVERGVS